MPLAMTMIGGSACGPSAPRQGASWGVVTRADRWMRRPLVVLVIATLVALAVFILATPRALPVLGGLVATLAIGLAGPWLSLVGLRGHVMFSAERCRVGDHISREVIVTRFGKAVAYAAAMEWPASAASGDDSQTVIPHRRGLFPRRADQPRIASDWPFGILTAGRLLAVPRPLVVWPQTAPVRFPLGLVAARRPGRDPSTGLSGGSGDVLGVRDYRPGDTIRSIHWPQTARRGDVIVCERPGAAAARVRIVVAGETPGPADMAHTSDDEARLDVAVSIAASLVESWTARGADLEIAWTRRDGSVARHRPRDRRGLEETLDAVACIDSVGRHPDEPQREVDLDVVLTVSGRDEPLVTPARGTTRIVVAFDGSAGPDTIVVPLSSEAPAALDQAFMEFGHDPDSTHA